MIKVFVVEKDRELISRHTGKCVVIFNGHKELSCHQRIVYNKRGHIDRNPINNIRSEDSIGVIYD